VELVPPTLTSPGGDVTVRHIGGGTMRITRLADGAVWDLYLDGSYPAVSPDGTRLLWEVLSGEIVPGSSQPGLAVWVSNLDGSLPRRVHTQAGGWSMWLDAHRLLLVKRIPFMAETQLYILDIDDPAVTPVLLGAFDNVHGLQVAPGGGTLAFYLTFQENPDDSGVYVLVTQPGAAPRKLEFFGSYRWRDDQSLYTLSYDIEQDVHTLGYIDISQGTLRTLTDPEEIPLRIANGEWSVSPDGTRIVYVDPADYGLYTLAIESP
jgi:Tol biopolymer transport system component